MKKLLAIVAILIGLSFQSNAQQRTLARKQFDTWSISGYAMATNPNTDAGYRKSFGDRISINPAFSVGLSKQMSHFVSFELNGSTGAVGTKLTGQEFKSHFSQYSGRIRFNFTNGQILSNYRNTQFYLYTGIGMCYYTTTANGIQTKDKTQVVPIGGGVKFLLNPKISLNFDDCYNYLQTDNFDKYHYPQSNRDGYSTLAVGLQYTFGSKNKPLEWDRPLEYFRPLEQEEIASTPNKVDTIYIKAIKDTTPVVLPDIKNLTLFYQTAEWLIEPIYKSNLDQLLQQLQDKPNSYLLISAYCDSTGSDKVNQKVVKNRGDLVAAYFINNGIDQKRLKINVFGKEYATNPILSRNRRVMIKFID